MVSLKDHVQHYDHAALCWTKKQHASAFADFLAAELGISRKGVVVESDRGQYYVYVPLFSKCWMPTHQKYWQQELDQFKKAVVE